MHSYTEVYRLDRDGTIAFEPCRGAASALGRGPAGVGPMGPYRDRGIGRAAFYGTV